MKTIRAQVRGSLLHGVRTTDAARPMRDALLSCPTDAEWRAYSASVAQGTDLGMVWNGIESALDALDDDKRKMICDRFDAYKELKGRKKAVGALDSGTQDFDPFGRRENAKLGDEINRRNKEAWNQQSLHGRGRIAK
jgi:hypothetical protein